MGAKFEFKGVTEYIMQIEQLGKSTDRIVGKAIYAGAEVTTDAIRKAIENLPETYDWYGVEAFAMKRPILGVTRSQKKGLLEGLGIAEIQDNMGKRNVKIGFDGHNSTRTKKFPNGQPNVLVAQGVEFGSSTHIKTPFVRPTVNNIRHAAEIEMKSAAEIEMRRIMDEIVDD